MFVIHGRNTPRRHVFGNVVMVKSTDKYESNHPELVRFQERKVVDPNNPKETIFKMHVADIGFCRK